MPKDDGRDVYRWMERQERKKKLKTYVFIALLVVALLLFWILKRANFIVILSLPQLIGIAVAFLVILAILFII